MLNLSPTEFLTALRQSEIGRALLDQREQTVRAERQETVARLRSLHREQVATAKKFDTKIAPLKQATEAALKAAREAEGKLHAMGRERQQALSALEHQCTRIEAALRAGASPEIDAAISRLYRRWEELR